MSNLFDRLKTALADRYIIEREIGAGGMATVYLAEDIKHHRKVAVKVLRPELAATLGPERFLREIEVAANLTHPHILPLHDSGEADGFLFYVMPYVEGQSLRDRLAAEGELPVQDAVKIIREVVDALAHAHEHGVVHRDVKPDNVLLSGRHALVVDFGVAKAVTEATGRQALTTKGVALGTPAYMAPEQAVADPHIDHRADIYAVGTLAYELLTGRPPFAGTSPQMILSAHVTQAPEPVTKYRQAVPPALAQLVMKCLEKKPADRWQSAEELLPQLEALVTPSGGTTPVLTATFTGATATNRWYAIGAAALVAVLGVWLGTRIMAPGADDASSDLPRIVVLPLENLSASEEEFFADGMTEAITSRLAGVSGLRILSRQTAIQFKDSPKTAQEIAEELEVDYVLEGTVMTDRTSDGGGQVRITPQLIRASDDTHLWANEYIADLVAGEIFSIQAEIAERITESMDVALLGPERMGVEVIPTQNMQAYDRYLRAKEYLERAFATRQDAEQAAELFEEAIALDPAFASAHAALAQTEARRAWQWGENDARSRSEQALEQALRLAPEDPDVRLAVAEYKYALVGTANEQQMRLRRSCASGPTISRLSSS